MKREKKGKSQRKIHQLSDNILKVNFFPYLFMVIRYHFYGSHCEISIETTDPYLCSVKYISKIDIHSTKIEIY